jgi:hypothetical protein
MSTSQSANYVMAFRALPGNRSYSRLRCCYARALGCHLPGSTLGPSIHFDGMRGLCEGGDAIAQLSPVKRSSERFAPVTILSLQGFLFAFVGLKTAPQSGQRMFSLSVCRRSAGSIQ